jgi:hypothetical protein
VGEDDKIATVHHGLAFRNSLEYAGKENDTGGNGI